MAAAPARPPDRARPGHGPRGRAARAAGILAGGRRPGRAAPGRLTAAAAQQRPGGQPAPAARAVREHAARSSGRSGSVPATGTPRALVTSRGAWIPSPASSSVDPLQPAEQLAEHLDPRPRPGDLPQRRRAAPGPRRVAAVSTGSGPSPASRRPQSAMTSAGMAGERRRPAPARPARARRPAAGRTSRRAASAAGRRPARSAAATAPRAAASALRPASNARLEQSAGGRHVTGEQAGQDVAAAGVAFGQDDLGRPAERQRERRGRHAG